MCKHFYKSFYIDACHVKASCPCDIWCVPWSHQTKLDIFIKKEEIILSIMPAKKRKVAKKAKKPAKRKAPAKRKKVAKRKK